MLNQEWIFGSEQRANQFNACDRDGMPPAEPTNDTYRAGVSRH